MAYADPAGRAALIQGLRALAGYLETSAEVPAPAYVHVYVFPPDGDCVAMRAEIDAIAELLGSQPRETAWRPGWAGHSQRHAHIPCGDLLKLLK
jgi:hypothetical protein